MQAKKLSQELPSDVDPSMHGHPARSETAPSAISDPHAPTENPPVAGLAPEAMEVWRDATDLLREREHDQIHPISGDPAVTTHAGAQVQYLHIAAPSCFAVLGTLSTISCIFAIFFPS